MIAALFVGMLWLLWRPLSLLFLAIVVGEALSPIVRMVERWLPRGLAIASVYLLLLSGFAGLSWYLGPVLIEQGRELVDRAPALVEQGQAEIEQLQVTDDQRQRAIDATTTFAGNLIVGLPATITSSAVEAVAVLFLSVYWLVSAPAAGRFVRSLLPAVHRDHIAGVINEAGRVMGGYVRGVVIDALIIGLMATAGLWLIGFEYAVVGGLITAVGELFPVVGPVIAAVPIVALASLDSPRQAVIVLLFYVALQQVEGQIVTPLVMKSQTDVPEVLVLFALIAGAAFGGLLGALVAIPLAAAIRVIIVKALAPALRRRWTGPP